VILARVAGAMHSTINHEFYDGRRLLICDRLDRKLAASGQYLIAVDAVDAGVGETVLIVDEGNSARQVVGDDSAPIRSIIIGIVDAVYDERE
jgi:ethanolamine utilization protein EutN